MMRRWLVIGLWLLTISGLNGANIVPGDSSFEVSTAKLVAGSMNGSVSWQVVHDDAADGCQALQIRFPGKDWTQSRMFDVSAGTYTFSVYAKVKQGQVPAWICVWKPWNSSIYKGITLTDKWQRFSVTGKLQKGKVWLCLGANQAATIVTDAWQFEVGDKLTPYHQSAPQIVGLTFSEHNDRVFYCGEIVSLQAGVRNNADSPVKAQVETVITDAEHQIVFKKTAALELAPKSGSKENIEFQPAGNGYYLVSSCLKVSGDEEVVKSLASFVVVDKPVAIEKGKKPFCGVNGTGLQRPGIARMGGRWLEISLRWNYMEKHPGKLDWSKIEQAKQLKAAGYMLKGTIMGVPDWAWNREEAADAHKNKIHTGHYGLLPSPAGMKAWQAFLQALAAKGKGVIDLWEIGAEDDLNWGRNDYYRKKYSKWIRNSFVTGPLAERLAHFYDTGIEALRSVLPDAQIGLLRPSGVDCTNRDFTFSKAVFQHVKQRYDFFPLDPYCWPRYLGENEPVVDVPEAYLPDDIDRALALTKTLGDGQPVIFSEFGYAVQADEPLNSKAHLQLAKYLSRSCLLARLNPMVKLFQWYVIQAAVEGDRARYALWWGDNPMPAVAAFSAVAQVVENVNEVKKYDIGSSVNVYLFAGSNRATAAIWSADDQGSFMGKKALSDGVVKNYLGGIEQRGLAVGETLEFGDSPLFITVKGADAVTRLDDFLNQAEFVFEPVKMTILTPSRAMSKIQITSKLNKPLTCRVKYSVNKQPFVAITQPVELAALATASVNIPLPEHAKQLDIEIDSGNGLMAVKGGCELKATAINWVDADKVTLDGVLTEWGENHRLATYQGRGAISPPDPFISYQGNEDLSAVIYSGWNERFFYFAAKVNDDKQQNTQTGYRIWSGDCIQLAFDLMADAATNRKQGYDSNDAEMGVALTSKKGSEFYPWFGHKLDLINKTSFIVKRDEQTKTTCYEVKIPWKALQVKVMPDKMIGMNYVVLDDDDGKGAPYWIQLTGGVTGAKNPAVFKKFYLKKGAGN